MNAFAGIRPKGGQNPTPLAFFPWRLQWGLSVFQWGSNPHNPPPRQFLPWLQQQLNFQAFCIRLTVPVPVLQDVKHYASGNGIVQAS